MFELLSVDAVSFHTRAASRHVAARRDNLVQQTLQRTGSGRPLYFFVVQLQVQAAASAVASAASATAAAILTPLPSPPLPP